MHGSFRHTQAPDPHIQNGKTIMRDHPEVKQYFRMPSYCAFDQENNRLLVCDTMRHRIQIYQKVDGYQDPQFNL